MLRFLRRYSSSTGVKILYGVLALLFVGWGVGVMGGERIDLAARVHGQAITRRDLERQTALLRQRYEAMKLPAQFVASMDLHGQALDQLVEQALLQHEADRLGLQVTDGDVVQAITRMPELQDGGRFNRDRLETFLRYQRDRGEFEDDVRNGILFDRMRALVTDGVTVTPAEVTARFHLDHDKVDLLFAKVSADDQMAGITLSDDDLQKFLDEHADRYTVPTRVRARYVVFKPAEMAADVQPSDGDVANYYALHQEEEFTDPEQVRARHILVRVSPGADEATRDAARKKAEDLARQAKAGADFAALAEKNSDDPGSATQGGDLGLFPRGRMTPAFEEVAFSLEPGQVSDAVETPFGFHVIRVEEHHAAGPRPLDAVRDEIVTRLRHDAGVERARAAAEAVRKAVVRGKSLAEAAGDRPVVETEPFAEDDLPPGIGTKAFVDTAFALGEDEVSDLVETDDAIYLLAPFARVEAHTPPLADVRDRVEHDARRARAEEQAKARAEELLARARDVGLQQAAADAGIAVARTGPFDRRTSPVPKIGPVPALAGDALALTPEAPLAPKVYVAGGDAVVAALADRTPASEQELETARKQIQDTLVQQKQQAALTSWLDGLKQEAARAGELQVYADRRARG